MPSISILRGLVRAAIAHPTLVGVSAVLVVAAGAAGLFRLELRTDGAALVPPRSPAVAVDHAIRQEFGLLDPLVVLIRSSIRMASTTSRRSSSSMT